MVNPFAIVTGASSGIGFELARCCARGGFDLLIAADEPTIASAAQHLRSYAVDVKPLELDLSTTEAVDRLCEATGGRPVDALLANAGHGLGHAFLDQDFKKARHVIDTNITGTLYLVHKIGRQMRERGRGRILITGAEAGFEPGAFSAVYNGSKAFLESFAATLHNEVKHTGVSVTNLMPGATQTNFFERADLMDTRVARAEKDDPADVAKVGYEAMMKGDDAVVFGFKNKMQAALGQMLPSGLKAEQHRKMVEPGFFTSKSH